MAYTWGETRSPESIPDQLLVLFPFAPPSPHYTACEARDALANQRPRCSHPPSDGVNGLAPLPFAPTYDFDSFSNTFEDPFSYSARPAYDVPADAEPLNEESPAQDELDNKLLGFSAPLLKAQVFDGAGNYAETNITAELLGMFFVAEDVFGGDNTGRPLELTCYRRNLWQCSGQITLPRHISHVINEQGQQLPVFELAASISAMESIEGKPTEIISIPWKSSNGDEAKSPSAPHQLPLDLSTGQELDHNRISLPVSWKRLQFKHATANNGRRKGLQQHYVVQINLLSKMKNGEFAKIAEIQSGPVIVRGRSPRNFDSRKDVPLTGDKKGERRATTAPSEAATPAPKTERGADLAQNLQRYHSLGNIQVRTHHRGQTDFCGLTGMTAILLLISTHDSNLATGRHHRLLGNRARTQPRKWPCHPAPAALPCLRGRQIRRYQRAIAPQRRRQHRLPPEIALFNAQPPPHCPSICLSPKTSGVLSAPQTLYRLTFPRVSYQTTTRSRVPRTMMRRRISTNTSR